MQLFQEAELQVYEQNSKKMRELMSEFGMQVAFRMRPLTNAVIYQVKGLSTWF